MADPQQHVDDADLLRRIQFGNEIDKLAAFSELVCACDPRLRRHLAWKGLTPEECDDIANETWCRAWTAIRRFQQRGVALYAWVRQIGDHVCSEHFRHRYLGQPLDDVAEASAGSDDPILVLLAERGWEEVREAIRRVLAGAPEDYRNVVELGFFDEYTNEEIMELCEWSPDKLYQTRYRALRWLKDHLVREFGETTLNEWRQTF